jgi:hypothetical protein
MLFSIDEVKDGSGKAADKASSGHARSDAIAKSLDGLSWGMSKEALLALLKHRIRLEFEQRVKRERDIVRQDALYQEAKESYQRILTGFVAFDGKKTGWDVSPMADEFRHGSGESLLVVEGAQAREHYFFFNGRLWKWYRELKPNAFEGAAADYDKLSAKLRSEFGAAQPQRDRHREGGDAYTGLTFKDEHTRATLLQRGGESCLVFEDLATLDQLATLRQRALPRGPKQNNALDKVLMTAAEREAWRDQH